ncbi:MAG: extracellular solute-binding protein [Chloroflexi bacterium]|nr:extracellular solute-binding protein [Chloroflexota bacterium]
MKVESPRRSRRLIAAIVVGAILAACQPAPIATPTLQPSVPLSPTRAVTPNSPIVPTPTTGPASTHMTLRLWTSPEAAPGNQTPGGPALAGQLVAFEAANPGVTVEVRVKKASGVGGLLDFLRTGSAAAPAVLPDVIALSRDDLVAAANDRLIQPLTPLLPADSLSDFYPMTVAAGRVGDQLYGLPFSADAIVLVYRTEIHSTPPLAWSDVLTPTGALLIPAGDPLGLVTLQQYIAIGGSLTDSNGKPALDPVALAQVLAFYQSAVQAGILPSNAGDYADASAAWAAYREHRAALAAAPATLFLRERDRAPATGVTLLPTRDGNPLALGAAWSYALVTTDAARQPSAMALMQWLTAPRNVGDWSLAAGVLPPRSNALDAWPDKSLAAFASRVMSAAILQPDPATLAVLGPPIQQSATDVIAGRISPQAAAERAAAAVVGK